MESTSAPKTEIPVSESDSAIPENEKFDKKIEQSELTAPSGPESDTSVPSVDPSSSTAGTSFTDVEIPISKMKISQPESDAKMPESHTSIPEVKTPILKMETTVPESETQIPNSGTPRLELGITASQSDTNLSEVDTPISDTSRIVPNIDISSPDDTSSGMSRIVPQLDSPFSESEMPLIEITTSESYTSIPTVDALIAEDDTPVSGTTFQKEVDAPMPSTSYQRDDPSIPEVVAPIPSTSYQRDDPSIPEVVAPIPSTSYQRGDTSVPRVDPSSSTAGTSFTDVDIPISKMKISDPESDAKMPESHTSIPEAKTPIIKMETTVPESETQIPNSGTPRLELGITASQSDTNISEVDTPISDTSRIVPNIDISSPDDTSSGMSRIVPQHDSPFSETEIPLIEITTAESYTSIPTVDALIAEDDTPVSGTTFQKEVDTPMPSTSYQRDDPSISEVVAPIPSTSYQRDDPPIPEVVAPIPSTSYQRDITSIPEVDAPVPIRSYQKDDTSVPEVHEPVPSTSYQRDDTSVPEVHEPVPSTSYQRDDTSIPEVDEPVPSTSYQRDDTSIPEVDEPVPSTSYQRDDTSILEVDATIPSTSYQRDDTSVPEVDAPVPSTSYQRDDTSVPEVDAPIPSTSYQRDDTSIPEVDEPIPSTSYQRDHTSILPNPEEFEYHDYVNVNAVFFLKKKSRKTKEKELKRSISLGSFGEDVRFSEVDEPMPNTSYQRGGISIPATTEFYDYHDYENIPFAKFYRKKGSRRSKKGSFKRAKSFRRVDEAPSIPPRVPKKIRIKTVHEYVNIELPECEKIKSEDSIELSNPEEALEVKELCKSNEEMVSSPIPGASPQNVGTSSSKFKPFSRRFHPTDLIPDIEESLPSKSFQKVDKSIPDYVVPMPDKLLERDDKSIPELEAPIPGTSKQSTATADKVLGYPPLKWGFIITSDLVSEYALACDFVKVLQLLPRQHNVFAVASSTAEAGQYLASHLNISHWFHRYRGMAFSKDIQIVYISCPIPERVEFINMMLKYGKHVVCDPPLTLNKIQTIEVVKYARSKNLFLMEGLWSRFFPIYDHIRGVTYPEFRRQIGKVRFVSINFGRKEQLKERITNKQIGGGAMLELGPYVFQLLQLCFKGLSPVRVVTSGHVNVKGVDLVASVIIIYPNDTHAVVNCNVTMMMRNEAVIFGTRGNIRIPNFYCPTTYSVNRQTISMPLPKLDGTILQELHLNHTCGLGLLYQAIEVWKTCVYQRKQIESKKMPHADSIQLASLIDSARRQLGVIFSGDSQHRPVLRKTSAAKAKI